MKTKSELLKTGFLKLNKSYQEQGKVLRAAEEAIGEMRGRRARREDEMARAQEEKERVWKALKETEEAYAEAKNKLERLEFELAT